MGIVGPLELLVLVLLPLVLGCATWVGRDATDRTGRRLVGVLGVVGTVATFPFGLIAYIHLRHRLG